MDIDTLEIGDRLYRPYVSSDPEFRHEAEIWCYTIVGMLEYNLTLPEYPKLHMSSWMVKRIIRKEGNNQGKVFLVKRDGVVNATEFFDVEMDRFYDNYEEAEQALALKVLAQ